MPPCGICVFISGSEEKMQKRENGMLIYSDDMSKIIDMLLSVDGLKETYQKKHDRSWIRKVDDDLETGLLKLSDVQLSIIEKSIFENASVGDLKNELGLSLEEIRIEIKKAREILIRYI
jgi:hypothetical protein